MKKLVVALLAVTTMFALAGCDTTEDIVSDIQGLGTDITELTTEVTDVTGDLDDLGEQLQGALDTNSSLTTDLEALQATVTGLQDELDALTAENEALEAELALTNAKIKNALNRDEWATRKTAYNEDWTTYEAEYCFGIFDEDWTQEVASDYTHNTGLKFVITIEELSWGTEIFAKDSCGNYSVFIYPDSNYAFYSAPFGMFEEGKTYEVVLYKEAYFTQLQLGFLPKADLVMGDYGLEYPTDLSGVMVTEIS